MIDFYSGIVGFKLVHKFHKKICLAGIDNYSYAYKDLPFHTNVDYIVDSGAFQDVNKDKRLSFPQAIERQFRIIEKAVFKPKYIVSYDFLVDEKNIDGVKIKKRVDYELGEEYVKETIAASRFYNKNRSNIPCDIIQSCQGVTPEQYYKCAIEVLAECYDNDVFGFGGFCILGRQKSLVPHALLTFQKVLPLIKQCGLKKIHIFGVTYLDILFILNKMCENLELSLSIDSTALSQAARFGEGFNPITGKRFYIGKHIKNSQEIAVLNNLNFSWVCEDIEKRYKYNGKPGWLKAINFDYSIAKQQSLF